MQRRRKSGFVLLVALVLLAGGGWLAAQWREGVMLRTELELARAQKDEWHRLVAERDRLRAKQILAAELERLRADHAALPRLRAELDALRKTAPSP